ncbi:MAG: Ig-like domain-containing protein, partial [Gammaproteobacteria bacterium]|nr:Ig-like domain-containing protein [Gammaproteobacteria bacterium]
SSVDVAAPGTQIYSTISNGRYAAYSGSSMAVPHVSAVAAMVLGQNPGLSFVDVRLTVLNNVDHFPSFNGVVATGGRVNAYKALLSLNPGNPNQPTEPNPNEIVLSPSTAQQVIVGGQIQFSAQGVNGNNYQWRVSNAYAQIDADTGTFRGNYAGVVDVYLSDANQDVAGPVTVTVTPMVISPGMVGDLGFAETLALTAVGGIPPLQWTLISNPGVASLNNYTSERVILTAGLISGSYSLSLRDALSNEASIGPFSVVMLPFELTPASASLFTGQSTQLNASGGRPPYTWLSSDSLVASVNEGNVAALNPGIVDITAIENNGNGMSLISTISVNDAVLTINPSSRTLLFGETTQLEVFGGRPPYTWSSDNQEVVLVDQSGLVKPVFVGTTNVNVSDSTNPSTTVASTITVTTAPLIINNGNARIWMGNGNSVQLLAEGGIGPYTWQSLTPNIVSVNANGLVTAIGPGQGLVAVSDEVVRRGQANYHQTHVEVLEVSVQPISNAIDVGRSIIMSGTGFGQVSWSVDNTQLATIDSATGLLNTLRAGTVNITLEDGLGNRASTALRISDLAVVINSIPIGQPGLFIGDEFTLTGTGNTLWGEMTWSSSDPNVLAVVSNNLFATVSAIGVGEAHIILTDSVGNSANTLPIIVNPLSFMSTFPLTLEKGQTLSINANGKGSLSWNVSNPSVASISTSGLNNSQAMLTALQAGSVVVTLRDANGNEISSPEITITAVPVIIDALTRTALSVGETLTITGSGDGLLSWSVENSLGSFSANTGNSVLFSALAAGTGRIILTDSQGNSAQSQFITIGNIPFALDAIAATDLDLFIGDSILVSGRGNLPLTWSSNSSAVSVVSVSETSARVTAQNAGSAVISLRDNIGRTVDTPVFTISGMSISTVPTNLTSGQTTTISATGRAPLIWSVSDDLAASLAVATDTLSAVLTATGGQRSVQLIVSDANGNSIQTGFIAIDNPPISLVSIPNTSLSVGQSMTVAANGNGVLSWSASGNIGNFTPSTGNSVTFNATTAGIGVITVADAFGNTASSGAITVLPPPVVMSAINTTTLNIGDTINLSATGGSGSMQWSVSNGIGTFDRTTGTAVVFTASSPGIGQITVNDTFDVNNQATSATITVNTTPVNIGNVSATMEVNSSILISASGGSGNYIWTVNGGIGTFSNSTGVSTTFFATNAGSGSITVTDANDASNSATSTPISVTFPAVTISTVASTIAVNDTIALSASGGSGNYVWSVTGGIGSLSSSTGLSVQFTATNGGSGQISVADANDATNQASTNIINVSFPALSLTAVTPSMNIGDSFSISANGGSGNYIWSVTGGIGTLSSTAGSTILFTAATPGSGQIIVQDANNTANSLSSSTITVNAPAVTMGGVITNMNIGDSFLVSAGGGSGNYVWSVIGGIGNLNQTNGTTVRFTATTAGSGQLRVADVSNANNNVTSAVISVNSPPVSMAGVITNINVGDSFSVSASGGSGSYDWSVSGGIGSLSSTTGNSISFTANSSGTGRITLVDANNTNNQTQSPTISVTQPNTGGNTNTGGGTTTTPVVTTNGGDTGTTTPNTNTGNTNTGGGGNMNGGGNNNTNTGGGGKMNGGGGNKNSGGGNTKNSGGGNKNSGGGNTKNSGGGNKNSGGGNTKNSGGGN